MNFNKLTLYVVHVSQGTEGRRTSCCDFLTSATQHHSRCDQRLSEYTANFSQRYVSSYVLFTDYHADLFVDDVHST